MLAHGTEDLNLQDTVGLGEFGHGSEGCEGILVPVGSVEDRCACTVHLVAGGHVGKDLAGILEASEGDETLDHLVFGIVLLWDMGHDDGDDCLEILIVTDGEKHGGTGQEGHGIVLVAGGQFHDLGSGILVLAFFDRFPDCLEGFSVIHALGEPVALFKPSTSFIGVRRSPPHG